MPSPQGQQYAQPADLFTYGISQAALAHPSTGTTAQNAALLAASEIADSYLRNQFKLPLSAWGAELTKHVCWLAAYDLVCIRGFNPINASDQNYLDRYDRAMKWFRDVSEGKATPDVVDSSPNASPGVPTPDAQPSTSSAAPINVTGKQTRGSSCR